MYVKAVALLLNLIVQGCTSKLERWSPSRHKSDSRAGAFAQLPAPGSVCWLGGSSAPMFSGLLFWNLLSY